MQHRSKNLRLLLPNLRTRPSPHRGANDLELSRPPDRTDLPLSQAPGQLLWPRPPRPGQPVPGRQSRAVERSTMGAWSSNPTITSSGLSLKRPTWLSDNATPPAGEASTSYASSSVPANERVMQWLSAPRLATGLPRQVEECILSEVEGSPRRLIGSSRRTSPTGSPFPGSLQGARQRPRPSRGRRLPNMDPQRSVSPVPGWY